MVTRFVASDDTQRPALELLGYQALVDASKVNGVMRLLVDAPPRSFLQRSDYIHSSSPPSTTTTTSSSSSSSSLPTSSVLLPPVAPDPMEAKSSQSHQSFVQQYPSPPLASMADRVAQQPYGCGSCGGGIYCCCCKASVQNTTAVAAPTNLADIIMSVGLVCVDGHGRSGTITSLLDATLCQFRVGSIEVCCCSWCGGFMHHECEKGSSP